MTKKYSHRSMSAEGREYFFPKANPPRTVVAKSQEEAEKTLESNK